MRKSNYKHLLKNQITWAVIDKKELPDESRKHLSDCRLCQEKVEQLMAELEVFGEKAQLSVPPLTKTMSLPQAKSPAPRFMSSWIPFAGAAAMAGLVLFFYFMGMNAMSPELATVQEPENLLEDDYLVQEISEMEEYPLPDELYEMTTEDTTDFEDDFLQYVVPDFQEDLQS